MEPRTRHRDLAALVAALVTHALLFVTVKSADTRNVFERREREPVTVTIVDVRPPPEVPPDEQAETPPEAPPPRVAQPQPPLPQPPLPDPATAPPTEPVKVPFTVTPEVQPPTGESVMRLKKDDGAIGRVLGTGGPLGPSAAVLEGALDVRADGPMSDKARVQKRVKDLLLSDLADDEVTAGLTDDYFRELRNRVEGGWRPAMRELNDGGERVTQLGMMRDVFQEREAWGEMWLAYMDLAKQYAQGQKPALDAARRERLKELMRSRKGMFRVHAISEVVLTQAPDGKVLTVEMPMQSGHTGIDDGVKDAIVQAVAAMPDPPSLRVHGGKQFSSTWRFRATWTMVPPTAFFTGAGFDITPKGFQIDVPFDIKLKTNVMLLRTLTHGKSTESSGQDGAQSDGDP